MRKTIFKPVLACALILLYFGCDSVNAPNHPTIRTVTTYQGAWTGTTSEGFLMSFTVVGNTITSFLIDILKSVPGKPAEQTTYALNKTETISGSYFTIQVSLSPASDIGIPIGIPVSGHFTSTIAAEGTSIPSLDPGVTWKAEKK